ncbi:hypothetical protein P7C70_g1182, partial [Phenoliferia sp. Uapishka_3]
MQSNISQTPPMSDASGVQLDPAFVTPRTANIAMPAASIQAQVGDQTVGPPNAMDIALPPSTLGDSSDSLAHSPTPSSEFQLVNRISVGKKQKARELPTSELQFTGHHSDDEAQPARAYSPDLRFGNFSALAISDDGDERHVEIKEAHEHSHMHPDREMLINSFQQIPIHQVPIVAEDIPKVAFEATTGTLRSSSLSEKKTSKKASKKTLESKANRRRSRVFGGVGTANIQATPMRGAGARIEKSDSSDSSSSSSSSSPSSDDSTSEEESSSSSSDSDDIAPSRRAKRSAVEDLPVFGSLSGIGKGLTKIAEPKRYSGEDDTPRGLRMWERDVRSYLLMGNVHPDSYLAVAYIGSCLAGEAKRWYGDHVVDKVQKSFPVNNAHSTPSPYSLKKIVANLTSRFVSETSYRDATFIWNRISQIDKGRTKTVNALALTIEDVAMDRYETSELDMKIKLVDALIPEIAEKLFEKYPNIESSKLKWKTLIKSAIRYERGYNQRQSVKRAKASGKSYSTYEMNTNGKKFHREMHDFDPSRRNSEPVYRSYPDNSGRFPDQKGRYGNGGRYPQMPNHVRTQHPPPGIPRQDQPIHRAYHLGLAKGAGQAPPGPARFPNNIQVNNNRGNAPQGPRKVYTDAEKAQYKERRDGNKCYVCGSTQHKADFHKRDQNSAIWDGTEWIGNSSEDEYVDSAQLEADVDGFDETPCGETFAEVDCSSPLLHKDGSMRLSLRERKRRATRLEENADYFPTSDSDDDAFRETIEIVRKQKALVALAADDNLSQTPPTSPLPTAPLDTPIDNLHEEMDALNLNFTSPDFTNEESIAARKAAEGYESDTDYQYNPNFDPPSPGEPSSPVFSGVHRDDDDYWPRAPHEVHTLLDSNGNEFPGTWVEIRADEFEWIENGHNLSQQEVDDFVLMHQMQLDDATRFTGAQQMPPGTTSADAGPSSERELQRQTLRHFRNMAKVRRDIEDQAALISHVNKSTDDLSDRETVAPAVYQPITLNGEPGFQAFVDTGSSLCIIAPDVVRSLKLKIHKYHSPKSLMLGTKGSRSVITSYCLVPIIFCGIHTTQKADVANIFSDFLIGRDLLRKHKVTVQLEPDLITVRDLPGTIPREMRKAPSHKGKHNKFRAAAISIAKLRATHNVPSLNAIDWDNSRPSYMRPIGNNEPIFDPTAEEEDNAYRPVYTPITEGANKDDFEATEVDFAHFFEWCKKEFRDIFIGDGDELPRPPLRVIQHEIPYIDESDPARPRRNYKIPEKYLPEWNDLYDKHTAAGIWIPLTTKNSDPMMPVIKKDGKFRPVTDLRARNLNTIKLGVPPMEGNWIRTMLAKYKHQVVLDAKGMFQQMRLNPNDVWKTTTATPNGDVASISAQQGDTNSGATQNRLLQHVYRRQQGRIMVNYADNIFVFANTWREMRANTIEVLVRSRVQQLYMNVNSFEVCPPWVNVLGMRIRHNEVRMDADQRDAFLAMREPHDLHSLQRYVGTIQWLSQFIPHLAELLVPLTNLTGGTTWRWTASQQLSFDQIKTEVETDRVLTVIKDIDLAPDSSSPIHLAAPPTTEVTNPTAGSYIFLVTDASATGVSATISVGNNWWNAKPVSNHSRKLTSAQHNYATHEQELLAVFEGFQKFESQLIGRKVYVITDNKSLQYFLTSKTFTPRQARVYDFLSKFDFSIQHIDGVHNHLADTLSRQFEGQALENESSDPTMMDLDSFAAIETIVNEQPEPPQRFTRAYISRASGLPVHDVDDSMPELIPNINRKTRQRKNRKAARAQAKADIAASGYDPTTEPAFRSTMDEMFSFLQSNAPPAELASAKPAPTRKAGQRREPKAPQTSSERARILELRKAEDWDLPSKDELEVGPDFQPKLIAAILDGYVTDPTWRPVRHDAAAYAPLYTFDVDGFLWNEDPQHGRRMVIPRAKVGARTVHEILLEHMHEMTGHLAEGKLTQYAQEQFWWPTLTKDIAIYVRSCPSCQACKSSTTLQAGKLHSLPVPSKPYESIGIDFQGPFSTALHHGETVDFVCNFIDHFSGELISIPCNQTISAAEVAELYFSHVFPSWGVPQSLSSDRDPRFRSDLWQALFKGLGTTIMMSSAYHPQSNPFVERVHRDLNAMYRQWVNEDHQNWALQLPFVQFAHNTSKSSSSGFSPFELTRIVSPTSLPPWASAAKSGSSGSKEASILIEDAHRRLATARDNIQRARLSQALQANKHRKPSPENSEENAIGSLYWLSTLHLNPLPARSRKWLPKFVGPFPLKSFDALTSTYTLDLPARYSKRHISPTFHASHVKRHVPNDDSLFPRRLTNHVPIFPLDVVATDNPMGITSIKSAFRKPDRFNPDVDHIWLNVGFNHGGEGTLRHDDTLITTLPAMQDANGTLMGSLFQQFLQSKDVDNVTDLARVLPAPSKLIQAFTNRSAAFRSSPNPESNALASSTTSNSTPRKSPNSTRTAKSLPKKPTLQATKRLLASLALTTPPTNMASLPTTLPQPTAPATTDPATATPSKPLVSFMSPTSLPGEDVREPLAPSAFGRLRRRPSPKYLI